MGAREEQPRGDRHDRECDDGDDSGRGQRRVEDLHLPVADRRRCEVRSGAEHLLFEQCKEQCNAERGDERVERRTLCEVSNHELLGECSEQRPDPDRDDDGQKR